MNLEFYDIRIPSHKLYHCSSKEFDRPTYQDIDDARSWSQTHHNSVLGLWCSTYPEMCRGFGPLTYECNIQESAKLVGITYEQWFMLGTKIYRSHQSFINLRNYLLTTLNIDAIYITDASNLIGEVIVVNFDKLSSVLKVDNVSNKEYLLEVKDVACVIESEIILSLRSQDES